MRKRDGLETVVTALDSYFVQKKFPIKKDKLTQGEAFYQGVMKAGPQHLVPFNIVISKNQPVSDYQISYTRVAFLNDYADKANLLEWANQWNLGNAYYYTVCLAADGEIFLRLLSRTTTDVAPLYDMLVMGSKVVQKMCVELQQKFSNVTFNE